MLGAYVWISGLCVWSVGICLVCGLGFLGCSDLGFLCYSFGTVFDCGFNLLGAVCEVGGVVVG